MLKYLNSENVDNGTVVIVLRNLISLCYIIKAMSHSEPQIPSKKKFDQNQHNRRLFMFLLKYL